jgi:excisionase family DNA binding protein
MFSTASLIEARQFADTSYAGRRSLPDAGIPISRGNVAKMKDDSPAGIKEIAHTLGCSTRTIRRMHANGSIKSFKLNGPTSPIRMGRTDLRRLAKKKGKD